MPRSSQAAGRVAATALDSQSGHWGDPEPEARVPPVCPGRAMIMASMHRMHLNPPLASLVVGPDETFAMRRSTGRRFVPLSRTRAAGSQSQF